MLTMCWVPYKIIAGDPHTSNSMSYLADPDHR